MAMAERNIRTLAVEESLDGKLTVLYGSNWLPNAATSSSRGHFDEHDLGHRQAQSRRAARPYSGCGPRVFPARGIRRLLDVDHRRAAGRLQGHPLQLLPLQ